jgi:glutaminyl-tRNA synthetase
MRPDDKEDFPVVSNHVVPPLDFLRAQVAEDLKAGKNGGRVHTRFPPEPNGYLHIGHSKAICIDFGIATENNGLCNLRFDDTNPEKETVEFEESIKRDIKWLGYDWDDRIFYASDYYEKIYDCAVQLIRDGKAYVDSLNADEIREHRGTLTEAGKESPYRNRSAEESLDLFSRMRAGEFPDGAHVVRAKIDMASGNINLRDPVLFRIKRVTHYRIGDKWCIYPMYDFAHTISDALEGITHSLCTLEFEDHRPLYEWILDNLQSQLPQSPRPRQIEFARLNVSYMITSKRKLLALVRDGHVRGWDDPRMPTLSGLRRAGYTPEAICNFVESVGVAKRSMVADVAQLEHSLREDLNKRSPRAMAVLRPLKVVIENYPEDQVEELEAVNNPGDANAGSRKVPFSRELYIEQEDFRETPPPKFFRLSPGREVRLRYAYFITCKEVIKDAAGNVVEVRCTYDPATKGGNAPDGRSPKATMHWVSATHSAPAEVRLYDRLFADERPTEETPLNPNSLEVLTDSRVEPSLAGANPGDRFQFERMGYFCVDLDSKPGALVFNRTVTLRDAWTKIEKKQK